MADAGDPLKIKNDALPVLGPGVREKDPVCGMTVDPLKAAASFQYEGKSYHFCSKRCAERFAAEPAKFLVAPGTAGMDASHGVAPADVRVGGGATGAGPAARLTKYTCPMHPEIVQIGPGSCPICGMALEPMEVSAIEEADPEYEAMLRRFWVSAALSVPLLVIAMGGHLLPVHWSAETRNWIELALATPVVLWGG